jgi:IS5 family transposase
VLKDLLGVGINPNRGREGMSAEQVLRVLLLKQIHKFSYEELEFHLADSATFRAFCGLGITDSAPSQSTLQRNIKVLSEETIASSHRMVLAYGLHQGIDDGKRTRTDSTVVNAAIHHPTDSSLLNDCVRVLVRLLGRARRWVKGDAPRQAGHPGAARRGCRSPDSPPLRLSARPCGGRPLAPRSVPKTRSQSGDDTPHRAPAWTWWCSMW